MFDKYLDPESSSSGARPAVVAGTALAAHLAVAGALLVSSAWGIEKIAVEDRRVTMFAGPTLPSRPLPGGGDGKQAPQSLEEKLDDAKRAKHKVEDLQPTDQALSADDLIVGDPDVYEDGAPGHPDGAPHGPPGRGPITGPGQNCPMPICGTDVIPKNVEIPPAKADEPVVVPSKWLDGTLIRGEAKIQPPETVARQINAAGRPTVRATVKMCLTKTGVVRSVKMVESSGYRAYDRELLREMRGWRYSAYTVNGKPVEVCTAVRFIYRMR